MKRITSLLAALATLISFIAISTPAEAHGRFRSGVYLNFGVPWGGYWGPRYYPRAYYDDYYYDGPPAVIVQRRDPPVYIERSDIEGTPAAPTSEAAPTTQAAPTTPNPQQPQHQWWYWCQSSEKYFPYVKECPGGFQRVPAQPSPPANR